MAIKFISVSDHDTEDHWGRSPWQIVALLAKNGHQLLRHWTEMVLLTTMMARRRSRHDEVIGWHDESRRTSYVVRRASYIGPDPNVLVHDVLVRRE